MVCDEQRFAQDGLSVAVLCLNGLLTIYTHKCHQKGEFLLDGKSRFDYAQLIVFALAIHDTPHELLKPQLSLQSLTS